MMRRRFPCAKTWRPPIGVLLLLCLMLSPEWSMAEEPLRLDTSGAEFRVVPRAGAQAEAETDLEGPAPRKPFGTSGTEWILAGGTFAYDFDNNTDVALSLGYSRFLADDVEWLLELSAWYHSQEGDDAASLNPAMEFRWHFWNIDTTSAFLNVGIGVLGATDNVPDMGTGFNFTPRIGAGITHQIADNGTRLVAGLRWHHISNARISGEDRNPSRDAPGLFLQLAFPF